MNLWFGYTTCGQHCCYDATLIGDALDANRARRRWTFAHPSAKRRTKMTPPPSKNSFRNQPDERGHFGQFGGRYVAETLMPLILDLEREYIAAKADPAFRAEFDDLLKNFVGRPSPLYYAERMTEHYRASAPDG